MPLEGLCQFSGLKGCVFYFLSIKYETSSESFNLKQWQVVSFSCFLHPSLKIPLHWPCELLLTHRTAELLAALPSIFKKETNCEHACFVSLTLTAHCRHKFTLYHTPTVLLHSLLPFVITTWNAEAWNQWTENEWYVLNAPPLTDKRLHEEKSWRAWKGGKRGCSNSIES